MKIGASIQSGPASYTAAALIPILLITLFSYFLVDANLEKAVRYRQAIKGADLATSLFHISIQLQMIRGRSYMRRHGGQVEKEKITKLQNQVLHKLNAHLSDEALRVYGIRTPLEIVISKLKVEFQRPARLSPGHVARSFDRYSDLITDIHEMMIRVVKPPQFFSYGQKKSHFIRHIFVRGLPFFAETVGKVRGFAAGRGLRKNLSADDRLKLYSRKEEMLHQWDGLKREMKEVSVTVQDMIPIVTAGREDLDKAMVQFCASIQYLLDRPARSPGAKQIFDEGSRVIELVHIVHFESTRIFKLRLDRALTALDRQNILILSLAFLAAAISIFFSFQFYWMQRNATAEEIRSHKMLGIAFKSNQAIVITDENVNIIRINDAFLKITGYTQEEVIGKNPSMLQSGRYDKKFYEDLYQKLREEGSWEGEIWNKRKNGEVYVEWLSINSVKDENGVITNYIGTFFDLSNLYRVRETVRFLLEALHEGICGTDLNGDVIFANSAFLRILGYESTENLIGKNLRNFLSFIDSSGNSLRLEDTPLFETIMGGSDAAMQQAKLRKNTGKFFDAQITIQPTMIDGSRNGFVLTLNDVSEASLVRQQRDLFFDSAGDIMCMLDFEGRIIDISPSCEKILGYSVEEMMYQSLAQRTHEADKDQMRRELNSIASSDFIGHSFELRHEHKNGGYEWLSWTMVKQPDLEMIYAVARDITDQKINDAMLVDAREESDRANQAKSEFLARMSHELRTPLNAIIGFSQLMDHSNDMPDDLSEYSLQIYKSGHILLNLINDILDLSKIEAGRIDLHMDMVPITEVIDQCHALVRPIAAKRGIQVFADYENFKGVNVHADRTRLIEVILNLLSNAIKYGKEDGMVNISLILVSRKLARIHILDDGPGIPEELQSRLFQPFERLGAEHSQIEGTGIGLNISKRIVELMGGRIGVESNLGKGSNFWIELEQNSEVGSRKMQSNFCSMDTDIPLLSKDREYNLLYVEDNWPSIRVVEHIFSQTDPPIKLTYAPTPTVALEKVGETDFDLLLLDIHLPDMNGLELLVRMREVMTNPNTPAIAISAYAMPEEVEKARHVGILDYITKPIDIPSFRKIIWHYLSKVN